MRYLTKLVRRDLTDKMVFVAGPRQCGKTTLAKELLAERAGRQSTYLNWDDEDMRPAILARQWGGPAQLVALDELHKFPRWKGWLKGIWDTRPTGLQVLVTGSARLDVYRRGGDSLFGRHRLWRLHPFCLGETPATMTAAEALRRLMMVGGFPEPFLDGGPQAARRWRRDRFRLLFREDLRDLESVRKTAVLDLFVQMLRERVGSPVVLASMARDLQVSWHTLSKWLDVLECLYIVFIVRPWTRNVGRAVQKPPKVFFFDNQDVLGDEGARFENLVATHLYKRAQLHEDRDGYTCTLHYLRDKEGREVDFLLAKDGKVDELVEAKLSDTKVSPNLRYYAERLMPRRARQIVYNFRRAFTQGHLEVLSAEDAFYNKLA